MPIPGQLTRDGLSFSIPSDGPLYPSPPFLYKGASLIVFEFETDGASAARLLPAQASLADVAVAGLVFANYPESSLGPYVETVLYLHAQYQGAQVQYATHLYVTTDAAMAAGREMGGFPKKIAAIAYDEAGGAAITASLERPVGTLLASAALTPVGDPTPFAEQSMSYLTLRVIPSPYRDAPPSIAELLGTDWVMTNGQVWQGEGTCQITGASAQDPLQMVPIRKVLGCKLIHADLRVGALEGPRSQPF
jgi:acetoacetate decarboxylase